MIGNSSAGVRETSIYGIPAIDVGTRQKSDPVFISHGDCIEDAEYLAELVKERFPGHEIRINYIGPVIGTHAGAGTLALFFKGKHR